MDKAVDNRVSGMGGAETLPRRNGELVFEAPWESRAFGMAVGLSDAGVVEWPDFREALVSAIKESEQRKDGRSYYEQWLSALERVALEKGMVTEEGLQGRMRWLEEESRHGHE